MNHIRIQKVNWRKFCKLLFLLVVFGFLVIPKANAQVDNIMKALSSVKENNIDSARYYIDIASLHAETIDSASTWYYKGFIYRELDKKNKKILSEEREMSIQFYLKGLALQKSGKYSESIKQQLEGISIAYFNDGVLNLQKNDGDRAVENFNLYKQTLILIKPNFDFTPKIKKFYLTMGTMYTTLYAKTGENNLQYWKNARDAYDIVLKLDPENTSGNYNLGILYYNRAVNIINNQSYEITLATLNDIQDTSIVLFRKSLPHMKVALKYEPENKNTLGGLAGIYFALNDSEKAQEIKDKIKTLKNAQKPNDK